MHRLVYPPFFMALVRLISTLTLTDLDVNMIAMGCMDLPVTSFNVVHNSIMTTSIALAFFLPLLVLGSLKMCSEQRSRKNGEAAQTGSFTSGHCFTFAQ